MLKYIGDGSFIPGVPARDLTDEEVKEYGGAKLLLSSGLYAEEPKENKMILPKEDKKGVK